jgi:hypothetical protein
MHNGLKPSRRAFKGVGFGRALPSAFDFGNGWHSDGINDHFRVPALENLPFPKEGTFEFWVNAPYAGASNYLCSIRDTADANSFTAYFIDATAGGLRTMNGGTNFSFANNILLDGRMHFAVTWATNGDQICYINGARFATRTRDLGTRPYPANVTRWYIGCNQNTSGAQTTATTIPLDEVRFYNKVLADDEVRLNYNSGIGANPCNAENLFLWASFSSFVSHDFGGTLGVNPAILDKSGKNNHLMAINQDTNPASGGYVLKPF